MSDRIDEITIKKINRLAKQGKTVAQIALQCSIGRTSVWTYMDKVTPEMTPRVYTISKGAKYKVIAGPYKGFLVIAGAEIHTGVEGLLPYCLVTFESGTERHILVKWMEKI